MVLLTCKIRPGPLNNFTFMANYSQIIWNIGLLVEISWLLFFFYSAARVQNIFVLHCTLRYTSNRSILTCNLFLISFLLFSYFFTCIVF